MELFDLRRVHLEFVSKLVPLTHLFDKHCNLRIWEPGVDGYLGGGTQSEAGCIGEPHYQWDCDGSDAEARQLSECQIPKISPRDCLNPKSR